MQISQTKKSKRKYITNTVVQYSAILRRLITCNVRWKGIKVTPTSVVYLPCSKIRPNWQV